MGWRYIAQRLPGGEFLDWDLPLDDVELTTALNAPGGLTATVPVEVARLKTGPGQEPVLQRWRTAIWAEADGQIRGGGVVTGVRVDDQGRLRVECTGLSGALVAGQPWTAGPRDYLQADPLDVVRDIYAHVQGEPGGNLGLQLDTTTSPVRVGLPEDPQRREGRLRVERAKTSLDAAKKTLDKAKALADSTTKAALRAAGHTDLTGKIVGTEAEPSKTKKNLWYRPSKNRVHKVAGTPAAWVVVPAALAATRTAVAALNAEADAKKVYDAAKAESDKAREAYDLVSDRQAEDAFSIDPWSTHDLGKVVDDLATDTPFDMVEHTAWSGGQLSHRLELTYPRRGRRRDDLRFVIGENVEVPREAVWGEDYASHLQILGAGEGHKMVRVMQPTGAVGIRRVKTVTDKRIGRTATAAQRARVLAPSFTGGLRITDVAVHDHPHARVGELVVGDEINLLGRIDWADIDMWLRVTAITYRPKQSAVLGLRVTAT